MSRYHPIHSNRYHPASNRFHPLHEEWRRTWVKEQPDD